MKPSDNFNKSIDSINTLPNGKIYITKDTEYVRYSDDSADVIDSGYPKQLDNNWGQLPGNFKEGFDSMASLSGNITYVTKVDHYIRYSDKSCKTIDPGYPKQITDNWGNLPWSFQQGFDAMSQLPNGKLYVFKGSEYVRYSNPQDLTVDKNYPKTIKDNWGDIPDDFNNGIDAIAVLPNGKTYMFKGNQYIRYSDDNCTKVDKNYPKSIKDHWGFEALDKVAYH